MSPLNPLFSIIIFIIAYLTAHFLKLIYKFNFPPGRYDSIDGMRGLLALSVFICHSSVWHQYINNGSWEVPKSNLYTQYGQTSVLLFFMITSFLFVSKLLNAKNINWMGFFVSRFFRIAPMYLFSFSLILIFVMVITKWHLSVGRVPFLKSLLDWSFFTIRKTPTINNFKFTNVINAGVEWSLTYEWLFYFSLPIISLAILKIRPNIIYIITGIAFIIFFYINNDVVKYYVLAFGGGAIASLLRKFVPKEKTINEFYATPIILVCLYFIGQFNNANSVMCVILITVIFILVAQGNSLFGLLKNSTLKFMGEICYSTYLLHGIILFTTFYFGFGLQTAKSLDPLQYCLVIFAITPIVIVVSYLGFKYIEKPCMDKSKFILSAFKLTSTANHY